MASSPGMQEQHAIESYEEFYRAYCREDILSLANEYPSKRSLYVDYQDLEKFDPDLADELIRFPSTHIDCMEQALRQFDIPVAIQLNRVHVRPYNFPFRTEISNLRAEDVGNLISIEGIIQNISDVKPRVTTAVFECQQSNCNGRTEIPQGKRGYQEPYQCDACERQGPFTLVGKSSEFIDAQSLRIQEKPEGLSGGETPASIDVTFTDDQTGKLSPGGNVVISGILELDDTEMESPVFDWYIDGVSLTRKDKGFSEIALTEEEITKIQEIADQDRSQLLTDLQQSVAPALFGLERLKLTLLLQCVGGVTKTLPDGGKIRGDIHVLAMGDPGTGKSQAVQYVKNLTPRAIYTSGKGTSAAGLTAAAVRSDFEGGGEWTLEAGALVLADRGIAAVDELDKMDADDRSALHEALEQQQVSVSKAGINATMKSRCALLAAANPKYGRFDRYESPSDQIDLEPALLSRFDLIFAIMDRPDPEKDSRLARHILTTNHAGEFYTRQQAGKEIDEEYLESLQDNFETPIDIDLLRSYIAYAKQNYSPSMTEEAMETLRDFYVKIRGNIDDNDVAVPITARQLEALVRLSEATARLRLSNTVDSRDAELAVDLAKDSLEDLGLDPDSGEYVFDELKMSERPSMETKQTVDLIGVVKELKEELDGLPTVDQVKERWVDAGHDEANFEKEYQDARGRGELYNPNGDRVDAAGLNGNE